jgi:hypothetical protein
MLELYEAYLFSSLLIFPRCRLLLCTAFRRVFLRLKAGSRISRPSTKEETCRDHVQWRNVASCTEVGNMLRKVQGRTEDTERVIRHAYLCQNRKSFFGGEGQSFSSLKRSRSFDGVRATGLGDGDTSSLVEEDAIDVNFCRGGSTKNSTDKW